MDKDVKEFLAWLESGDCNIWELSNYFADKHEQEMLAKIFSKEQLTLLKAIMKHSTWALDEWHNKNDEESHKDIREQMRKLEARFRNHRHEMTKNFCGKAEY